MIQPTLPDDRRPPLTPQLAIRVTVIGGFALTMFAIIFFRLWFLQVLSGTQYVAQAKENRTRKVELAAPRGKIEDRNGTVLVDSRRTTAVQIIPTNLPSPLLNPSITELAHPPAKDRALYTRLAGVLGMKNGVEACKVTGYQQVNGKTVAVTYHLKLPEISCDVAQAVYGLPYADATIATDVNPNILYYLSERHGQYPGVTEPEVNVTSYPLGDVASQVLGTVGPITSTEVKEREYAGLPENEVIGQTGLEAEYDAYLRGQNGAEKVEVDSEGDPIKSLATQPAIAGDTLKTSLDLKVQEVGQQSLQQSISANAPAGAGGAFVAMDPQNGQVYAMGSLPSFNPTVFTKPISDARYKSLFGAGTGDPLDNRAIDGLYSTGSTFKVITATAALESGVWNLADTYDDTGSFNLDGETLHNSGHAAYGSVDLVSAIRVSDDIFFYNLGALLNANPITHPQGGALQTWARLYGLGHPTGVDLPYEDAGTVPSPAVFAQLYKLELACEKKEHVSSCGIADTGTWTIGDNVNTGVGQGDDQVTPLQLAVVYSAVENGGTIVRPHIGLQVENPIGDELVQTIDPPPTRHISIDPTYLSAIQEGLREAASAPGGTSADVMGSFPEPVYGKTGTAETFPNGVEEDQAWYACYVPATATSKPIVVVVTVEKGGFGAVAAAPVARQILNEWFYGKPGPYVAGTSTTL
jgi:penicillin-binding protein 2